MDILDASCRLEQSAPEVEANGLVSRASYHLNDYRAEGRADSLAAAEDMVRRIASAWHEATGTAGQTTWLQVARYAVELATCREHRDLAFEHNPSGGIFGDGIPLEEMAPQAHKDILNAARHLDFHRRYDSRQDYDRVSDLVQRAAATLHRRSNTGRLAVWVQVAIYLTELHTNTLTLEGRAPEASAPAASAPASTTSGAACWCGGRPCPMPAQHQAAQAVCDAINQNPRQ
ncbi:hypothetical protein [Streptomyces griseorubiginosus]|uniref:hypothetical protein n=1 Tax=Streptomyces griseorubiginosus TaxID=67304 RepID=UPI0036F135D2